MALLSCPRARRPQNLPWSRSALPPASGSASSRARACSKPRARPWSSLRRMAGRSHALNQSSKSQRIGGGRVYRVRCGRMIEWRAGIPRGQSQGSRIEDSRICPAWARQIQDQQVTTPELAPARPGLRHHQAESTRLETPRERLASQHFTDKLRSYPAAHRVGFHQC